MVDFGKRLKDLRIQKGLTQEQLANRLGLTKSVISAYEATARYPAYGTLIKIASIFNVTTDYLLGVSSTHMIDISNLSDQNKSLVSGLVAALSEKETGGT